MHTGNSQTNDINHNQVNNSEELGHGGLKFRKGDQGEQGRDVTLNNLAPPNTPDGSSPVLVDQPAIAGRAAQGSQGTIAAQTSQASIASIASQASKGSVFENDATRTSVASQGSLVSLSARPGIEAVAAVQSQGSLAAVQSSANQLSLASQASFGSNSGNGGVASSPSFASVASNGSAGALDEQPAITGRGLVPKRSANASGGSIAAATEITPRSAVHQVQWPQ